MIYLPSTTDRRFSPVDLLSFRRSHPYSLFAPVRARLEVKKLFA